MKRTDQSDFHDFLLDEAAKFGKGITVQEIDLWFETFKRSTVQDFKLAWMEHKRDPKQGGWFPTINQLQRLLRMAGEEQIERDWRCAEEVSGLRCAFPGSIKPQGVSHYFCSAHLRLKDGAAYSESASLQIIEQSRAYRPPKDTMELMERGSAQRALEAERWRTAHGNPVFKRRPEDAVRPDLPERTDAPEADAHVAAADHARLDELNAALSMAAAESEIES